MKYGHTMVIQLAYNGHPIGIQQASVVNLFGSYSLLFVHSWHLISVVNFKIQNNNYELQNSVFQYWIFGSKPYFCSSIFIPQ